MTADLCLRIYARDWAAPGRILTYVQGARALLEEGSSEILRLYGWQDIGADLVLLIDASYPDHEVAVGFLGEGYSSCYVIAPGNMLGKRDIQPKAVMTGLLRDSEKVMAVSPIGFAKRSGKG